MKMAQTAFVDSLVDPFDIQYETQTPASVEFDLIRPKRIHEKEGDWRYKQIFGGLLWVSGMTRQDIASGPTCPQLGRPALEGSSENNCLPKDNQSSDYCFSAERGLETVIVPLMRVTLTDLTIGGWFLMSSRLCSDI